MAPILIIACVLFSLISSLGRERLRDLLWCLGATFTASASLSATLCFGIPWRKLSARLSKSGAALAGWQGMVNTTGSSNLLLSDIDLFPAGSVSLNGVKIFGDWSIEKVVGLTATLIRDSGSGLEKVFHDLLRSQGAIYRRGGELAVYEGGGFSEKRENKALDRREHREITGKYMSGGELFQYRAIMACSLAPLRTAMAESRLFSGCYHWIKERIYRRKA